MAEQRGIKRTMGAAEWLLLATLSILWGGSFFFAEVALVELRPLTVVLCRVGFAGLVLIALVYATGRRLPGRIGHWRAFFVMGALNNLVPFTLIVWGQTHIASGFASILNATTPVFTVVLAHLLTRDERMTPNRLTGVLLGLAGVAVMIGPEALEGLGLHLAAQLAVLGAALSYAFAGIFGRRFKGEPPLVVAAGQVTASSVLVLPLALVVDRPWTVPLPGAETWAAVAGLAVFSTALAYVIFFRILAAAGATNLLLVTLLIPASAILLGTLVLGERLEAGQLAGMAVIGLGLLAIDGRPLERLRASRSAQCGTRMMKGEGLDRED